MLQTDGDGTRPKPLGMGAVVVVVGILAGRRIFGHGATLPRRKNYVFLQPVRGLTKSKVV